MQQCKIVRREKGCQLSLCPLFGFFATSVALSVCLCVLRDTSRSLTLLFYLSSSSSGRTAIERRCRERQFDTTTKGERGGGSVGIPREETEKSGRKGAKGIYLSINFPVCGKERGRDISHVQISSSSY